MMKRVLWSFVLASLAPWLLQAQSGADASSQPESVRQVELKGKVPVNPETLRVQLPRPQEATLANGLEVYLIEDHKLPTFQLQFVIHGGGLADPPDKRGVAMVTASLLREGTKTRTSREIAEQLARLGSSLSASASPSSGESRVSVTGLVEHMDATLAITADVILNPTFPQSELDKFKGRFASQVQYQRSLPSFIAQERFLSAVYGEHPASLIVPPDEVIAALTPADLAQYHAAVYRPNNAFVLAHGAVSLEDLVARLERVFGSWEQAPVPEREVPIPAPPEKARVIVIDRPGSVQTSLRIGALGIDRRSDDYFALLVMNHILGGSPASRLFTNLREDKGYTYGVSSSFTGTTFPGIVVTTTDVRTEVTEGAMRELKRELERIANEPVGREELEQAKRALIGRFALSLDSPQALLNNLATQKIYGFPDDYWDKYPQRLEAITAADIQRVARTYYAPERLQIVAVGDERAIRKVLEQYGAVQSSN